MSLIVRALLYVGLAHKEPDGDGFTNTVVLLPVPQVVQEVVGFRMGIGTYDWDGHPAIQLWDDYSE